eukprot:CAMPEP_0171744692 /NCGR_PEP_ID=MMETSP0991-20121206/37663_1 /TAXON_ID=483369 /ORGANISM="non described non described, Strain CCMP2098" /LENGTH=89 /DNA_ID=CAMNT_0012343915 /DNA_START=45 /DNA_END=314 /DNA_ORIENTATION=-
MRTDVSSNVSLLAQLHASSPKCRLPPGRSKHHLSPSSYASTKTCSKGADGADGGGGADDGDDGDNGDDGDDDDGDCGNDNKEGDKGDED